MCLSLMEVLKHFISVLAVAVGEKVQYKCETDGQVGDDGMYLGGHCSISGFKLEKESRVCRDAVACNDPVPSPPEASNLQPSTSKVEKEFEVALFECKEGYELSSLAKSQGDSKFNRGGNFALTCGKGGKFPDMKEVMKTLDDKICVPKHCSSYPAIPGFEPVTRTAIHTNDKVRYKCLKDDEVTDESKYLEGSCSEGLITMRYLLYNHVPRCIKAKECPLLIAPNPPSPEHNLELITKTKLKEYDHFLYKCKAGFSFYHLYFDDKLTDKSYDMTADVFTVQCGKGGSVSPSGIPWPKCKAQTKCKPPDPPQSSNMQLNMTDEELKNLMTYERVTYVCKDGYKMKGQGQGFPCTEEEEEKAKIKWEVCSKVSKDRRKRELGEVDNSDPYDYLNKDIDYTMVAFFETQFMFDMDIAKDIQERTDVGFSDKAFPKVLVDTFHRNVGGAFGSSDQLGNFQFKFPLKPLCEQPMATLPPENCTSSGCKHY